MKREQIEELLTSFESARTDLEGTECWSARDLQEIFGYTKWQNFQNIIDKAREACDKAGGNCADHFLNTIRIVELPNGAEREIEDVALTRYAAYLVAQNGDPAKSEIAFAQTYFAVQTRKQEIIEQHLLDVERVSAREKLSKSEKKLSGIIYERGVDDRGFAFIRSKGDHALFGGASTNDIKRRLLVPKGRPLADFLPTLTIKAKDFATELTSHNVIDKDLRGEPSISQEHVDNNLAVRNILRQRGIRPETLPAAEDAAKLRRKLAAESKRLSEPKK